MDAGFDHSEPLARAFRGEQGQSPIQFTHKPDWQIWSLTHHENKIRPRIEVNAMQVDIIDFPETLVAALEHLGPENQTYKTSINFIQWRKENSVPADKGNTYGIHYTAPNNTSPEDFRMDICVSIENEVGKNPQGVVNKRIPACRCAVARHTGPRDHVTAVEFLVYEWLPDSGEEMGDFPLFFHYVNVGPGVREQDMITDVYLSLK